MASIEVSTLEVSTRLESMNSWRCYSAQLCDLSSRVFSVSGLRVGHSAKVGILMDKYNRRLVVQRTRLKNSLDIQL